MVLAMLHNLDTLEESLDTVGGGGVLGCRRHEEYPHSLDVDIRTELLCGFCRGGADAHLEGAQSVELHLLATSQVLVDIVQEGCHTCLHVGRGQSGGCRNLTAQLVSDKVCILLP